MLQDDELGEVESGCAGGQVRTRVLTDFKKKGTTSLVGSTSRSTGQTCARYATCNMQRWMSFWARLSLAGSQRVYYEYIGGEVQRTLNTGLNKIFIM